MEEKAMRSGGGCTGKHEGMFTSARWKERLREWNGRQEKACEGLNRKRVEIKTRRERCKGEENTGKGKK